MTNNQLTKSWLQNRIANMETTRDDIPFGFDEDGNNELAAFRLALSAMESEPEELPLDYLQGHKDGLEWASQLAKANHPETGDWLYDDPIELAKAIRKGPDMPPEPTVRDSEPVAWIVHARTGDQLTTDGGYVANAEGILGLHSTPLYRHAQQPVVPPMQHWEELCREYPDMSIGDAIIRAAWWNHCRAAMLNGGKS
ncbi:hypothetical protein [Klebsiella oxytoca]|uniref:hypothetical protein n=1 Tax=Klebsiella oxytoca TaxID=571 RepID=UPI001D0F247A|nr:hypothetical protein [Klebsiella oxytoca]